jgi:hypothetical protein
MERWSNGTALYPSTPVLQHSGIHVRAWRRGCVPERHSGGTSSILVARSNLKVASFQGSSVGRAPAC